MTADEREPHAKGDRPAPTPSRGGFARHVQEVSTRRPPPPKGRDLAIVVLGVLVVVAVILQFTVLSGGPGDEIRRSVEEGTRPRPVAPEGASTPPSAPRPPAPPPVRPPAEAGPAEPLPVPLPGASIEVPDGLSETTTRRLRLALAALTQARLIAESGVRDLPDLVREASADERERLAPFVVERLVEVVRGTRLGEVALDAALRLTGAEGVDLAPLVEAAIDPGLREDDTTAPALVFLGALAPAQRGAAPDAVAAVLRDATRPLHLRVLAAGLLVEWDTAADLRAALVAKDDTPDVLRRALRGE